MTIRRSLGFSGATQAINFLLSFGSVVIVSRLLTPEDIGVFSVSVALLGFAHILREFGVTQYLIQAQEVSRERIRAAFSVTLFSSWALATLLFATRNSIASFYEQDGVTDVIGLIALNFVILPFGSPVMALLRREMQFGKLAIISTANTAIQTIVTVMTALNGFGYMSMAWGSIAGMISNVIIVHLIRRGDIMILPTLKGTKEIVSFGYKSVATSLIGEVGSSAPDLILGRTLGFAAVAYYSRANSLIQMALSQLLRIVQSVFLPAFAMNLRKGENPGSMYILATVHVTGITAPLIAFLALMAEPLILFVFGKQWEQSAHLSTLFCLYALFQTPFSLASDALIGSGRIDVVLRAQTILLPIRVVVLCTSIWLPLDEVVALLLVPTIASIAIYAKALSDVFGLSFRKLCKDLSPSYLLIPMTLAAPAIARLADVYMGTGLSELTILLAGGALFAASWIMSIRLTRHPLQNEISRAIFTYTKRKGSNG